MTDYIAKHAGGGQTFYPKLFQGFSELKEALLSDRIQAGFLVAPMAIALRSQGVPIKVVYLGHRYSSSMIVRADEAIHSVADLRGKTIAVPSRFSDERLILHRALELNGLSDADVTIVEMGPPDMPSALEVKSIDAFVDGEPYPAQAEMGGYGRMLFRARDYWPDYMSCILVARQDLIDQRPEAVQELVDGIRRSGLWLDEGVQERTAASQFVGEYYFHRPVDLLVYSLTHPMDRINFSHLAPRKADFDLVRDQMIEIGVLDRRLPFEDYVDVRFADGAAPLPAWAVSPAELGR